MQRFFAPDSSRLPPDSLLSLAAAEAHHLRDVLRGKVGETIEIFDGDGWSRVAQIAAVTRREVVVRVLSQPVRQAVSKLRLTLAVAPPKADRLRWLVEKCVELDVDALLPLTTERSVVKPGVGKLDRLEDVALQACKQCGRNQLLTIHPLTTWGQFWTSVAGEATAHPPTILVADRGGTPLLTSLELLSPVGATHLVVVIGPEGGLTSAELADARARQAQLISLGRHTLRIESAAEAAAAIIRGHFASRALRPSQPI